MTADPRVAAARHFGTPLYLYDIDILTARLAMLQGLFGDRFGISYAIKANPNLALLRAIRPRLSTFDASSLAEVERAVAAGMEPVRITFSGPAKRPQEIAGAIGMGLGELVLESPGEARQASAMALAAGRVQDVLVRINPARVPKGFGASMAATPSQFGIDEEDIAAELPAIAGLPGLRLAGFHIYSGTNCRDPQAIAENFAIFADIFRRAQAITGIHPERLVFGSGFGIPYLPGEAPLDHAALPALVNPLIDALTAGPAFAGARCNLELGRWLVGPAGWLLTGVVAAKRSRGTDIRACDAGFNNHLAAASMMGTVIPRNWVFENLTNPAGTPGRYTLTGPLCTSIDRLALGADLPEVRVGDVLAIPMSGAYGLTASPTRFISHPEPREVTLQAGEMTDVTESRLNHWQTGAAHAG
jgi:diaminopimelate decarboxylase